MVRFFLVLLGLIFGLYLYEVNSGRSLGVASTFRSIGDTATGILGTAGSGGAVGGYGTSTSIGTSVSRSTGSLAQGIENNFRSIGGN